MSSLISASVVSRSSVTKSASVKRFLRNATGQTASDDVKRFMAATNSPRPLGRVSCVTVTQ